MLERLSPLSGQGPLQSDTISLREARDIVLTQLAGSDAGLKATLGGLPELVGSVVQHSGRVILRTGPKQVWVIGAVPDMTSGVCATPLSSSRSCFVLSGVSSRVVLGKLAPIDFHASAFKPGRFVMTGIHHMPALILCIADTEFHIYAMRTFALSLWEVIAEAAKS